MNKIEKIELWKSRIESRKFSGKSVNAWCNENELSPHAYYYWHHEIKQFELPYSSTSKLFTEVKQEKAIKTPNNSNGSGLMISWRDFSITVKNSEALPMAVELIN